MKYFEIEHDSGMAKITFAIDSKYGVTIRMYQETSVGSYNYDVENEIDLTKDQVKDIIAFLEKT